MSSPSWASCHAGFKATTFSSGRDFERAVVREAPAVCIMDLSLPDFDGVAILNELAAQDYRGRILLMSGHGQQVLRSVSRLAEGYHLHIVGCVKKPFTMKPVLQLLNGSPMQTFAPERPDVVDAIRNGQMVGALSAYRGPAQSSGGCSRGTGALAASDRRAAAAFGLPLETRS
jgi:FixJ family two-component response regulator